MAHRVLRYKIVHAENLHYLCKHPFLLARTPALFLRAAPTGACSPGPGNRSLMEVSQKLSTECIRAILYKVLSTYPTSLESKGTDLCVPFYLHAFCGRFLMCLLRGIVRFLIVLKEIMRRANARTYKHVHHPCWFIFDFSGLHIFILEKRYR